MGRLRKAQTNIPVDNQVPPERPKTAMFGSYDDMLADQAYQRAQNSKDFNEFTFWDTTSECPGCPEEKVVTTQVFNENMRRRTGGHAVKGIGNWAGKNVPGMRRGGVFRGCPKSK